MLTSEYGPLIIIGAVFLLIGIVIFSIGRKEEKDYCDELSNKADVRKYIEHRPDNIQAWGFKVGGYTAVVIGLVLLAMGIIFWL
jgi:dipeptide/tripeptide permease